MYGYSVLTEISPEQVLQKVTEVQIFEMIMREEVDVLSSSARYTNPCREDNNPGCRFETREDGTLLFVDFAEAKGKTHRTCFRMVMDYYGVTFNTAIRIICSHFGLSSDVNDYSPVITKPRLIEREEVSSFPTLIEPEHRPYEKRDKLFWSKFMITTDHLSEDNTKAVKRVTIKGRKGTSSFDPLNICYSFDFGKHTKLYQPYTHPEYKFITNCDENDIGNINNLPIVGKELIIQKSYKDHRVLRNTGFGLNVIWTQNEGCIPKWDILYDLSIRFELITIFYDNDEPGRRAASKLASVILIVNPNANVRIVYLPDKKYKDPGQFIHGEGRKDFEEVLKQIGIKPKKI